MHERVMGYIDGFNLYFGLRAKGWDRLLWLDPIRLLESLLKPHQTLVGVKYFTARLSGPGPRWEQQKVYLEALEDHGCCSLHFGKYQTELRRCRYCGKDVETQSEKMTDVNIGTEIVDDAHRDHFDSAILISGDGDLTPALLKVKNLPGKRVVVALPPSRASNLLKSAAHAYFMISRAALSRSQLPERMTKQNGAILERPQGWR